MKENFILNLLKKNEEDGLSITDIEKISKKSRAAIRIILAKLEGAEKIYFKKVGMAKLYYIK